MNVPFKYKVIIVFVVVQFFLDLLTKFYGNQYLFLNYGIKVVKLTFFLFFFGVLWKEKEVFDSRLYIYLTCSFLIGQLTLLYFKSSDFHHILLASRELILLLFPFVFWSFLQTLPLDSHGFKWLRRVFEVFIIIMVLSTLLGIIFPIPFLKTYGSTIRFGYMGLLHKSITASYFYITALTYFFSRISFGIREKICFLLTLIASLFVGTKAIYLFVLLLGLYHVIDRKYYKNKSFYIGVLIFSLFLMFFKQSIIGKIKIVFNVLYDVYLNDGVLAALSSLRSQLLLENSLFYFDRWTFINYLFGGRIVSNPLYEMSILDIFVFFGFLGGIYYFYSIYKVIFNVKGASEKCFFQISLCAVFFVSIFAGQFFVNISAITIVLLGFFFILNTKEENN